MAIFHSKYIRLGIWRVDDEGRFVASIDRRKFVVVLFAHIVYFVDYSTGKIELGLAIAFVCNIVVDRYTFLSVLEIQEFPTL
jgi:hypothetical protein